jgi:hypothetical protein
MNDDARYEFRMLPMDLTVRSDNKLIDALGVLGDETKYSLFYLIEIQAALRQVLKA